MNVAPLVSRHFLDSVHGLLGWSAGLAAVCLLYLPLYPSMSETDLLSAKLDALPKEMLDGLGMDTLTMGTPAGYAEQTVFAMLGLLIILIAAIGHGARAIAGDEEDGALELTLAHATGRNSLVVARGVVLVVFVAVLALVVGVVVSLLNAPSQLELPAEGIAAASAALGMIALFHGMLALAVGAATGRRTAALAVASVVAALGYIARNMGERIADWVPDASPFEWGLGGQPLSNGFDWAGLGALAAGCGVLALIALFFFARRDVRA